MLQIYHPESYHHWLLLLGSSQSAYGTANLLSRQFLLLSFAAGELIKRVWDYKSGDDYVLLPVVATMWLRSLQNLLCTC